MNAKTGQTLIDVAIEHCGSASAAWAIAVANGLSVTDATEGARLEAGMSVVRRQVARHYRREEVHPAGALAEGLGVWLIGAFGVK